jgi:tetratricopeptide (TPR) repeat protein
VSLSFGVGRYQPHAAGDVLPNQYGDCKDKHTLLASLAESIGLHASPVLMHSARTVDPDFPSPSQFDHVITRVAVGSDVAWLDATAEVAPFRLLAPTLRKKRGLVVNADGAARLEESPAATPTPNVTTADIDATLTESGTLSAHVRLTFTGDYELVMRTIFRRVPATQWKEILSAISGRGHLDGDVTDWKVANPAALRNPFSVEYQVKKANYVRQDRKDFELELPLSDWISVGPRDDEADGASPVDIGSAGQSSYKLRVELPTSLAARPPVSVSMKRDYAEYRADYTLEGRVFTVERSLRYEEPELPAARRGDFAAFTRAVSGDLRQSLALESRVAVAVDGLAKQSAKELYKSGTDAVDSQRYGQAVELLKRLVELEPTHNGGWTNLGRAYIGLHQTDAAIEAFRHQVAINAFDEYAYNHLGAAYRSQRKFPEAEAAFRQQLEIDPLDKFAHESLGRMYLEQHKYDAAVPELEKAIALSPLDASLRIRYGEAMLNRGDHDRALEIFSRAVDMDPSPLTWNDIAYRLALNHTDLDLAQRYAESAVSAVSAATRTIAIDHITVRDLWQIGSLGSYWDTLGWVYFAKGDTARAEKLVAAAWSLKQDAEVGDHLGQIFEKEGRREDAVRTYAVTMSAERADERTRGRLRALVGNDAGAEVVVREQCDQLQHDRTISLDVTGPAGSTADFYVLLDNRSGPAVVESVSFISGDEPFRRFGDALTRANFGAAFPDSGPAKILRRGTVSCGSSDDQPGSCRFVMMLPSEAQAAHRQ